MVELLYLLFLLDQFILQHFALLLMPFINAIFIDLHLLGLVGDLLVQFGHFLLEDLALVLLDGVEFGYLLRGFGLVDDPLETLV
jgi:hypothetical protein